jgi:hypothetical protein
MKRRKLGYSASMQRPVRDPDLRLAGLSLWVGGRQFPDEQDFWDGNWLSVHAEMRAPGAQVNCDGPILRTTEIERFRDQLRALHATLQGKAILDPLEPELKVTCEAQALGAIAIEIAITPDHLEQSHTFFSGIDQSYLPAVIAECDGILERFPTRGTPGE